MAKKTRADNGKPAPPPPPPPPPPAEPRQRQRGEPIRCPACGADAFIRTSKSFPGFLRVQYARCASPDCRHSWKIGKPRG